MRYLHLIVAAAAFSGPACVKNGKSFAAADAPPARPLIAILDGFSAAGIPARGPAEPDLPARNWPLPEETRGLDRHPLLYAGEGYNILFVVNQGKVAWTYVTGRGGEIDDVWML